MKQRNTYRMAWIRMAWITACAVTWAATGCSQSEDEPESPKEEVRETPAEPMPLTIASVDLQTSVTVTKATTAVPAGQSIGLFLDNADGVTSYTPAGNVRYDNGESGWSSLTPLELTEEKARVCAYYPYSESVTVSKRVSLTPHLWAEDETPLAYAPDQTVDSGNATIGFTLKPAYACLALTFERGDREDCTLKELTLENTGLNCEYLLDITTGHKTASTPAADGKLSFPGEVALPRNGAVTRLVLLPPAAALPGGLKVSVQAGASSDDAVSTTLINLTELEAGYTYAVTLTAITDTEVSASGTVEVDDFATGETVTSYGDID